jgi:hypothetical protein
LQRQPRSGLEYGAGLPEDVVTLLSLVLSEHPKRDIGIAELRAGKEKFAPQLGVHCAMIVNIQSAYCYRKV